MFIYSIIVFQSLPNIGFDTVWTPWSTVASKSGFGTISTLTGGIGKTVVTVLIPSVVVWVPTSDAV